jgi:RNA polymerase sigma factor (sigma-70 family)
MKIEEIYKLHFDKVYGFFFYKSYNQSVAEDLTSQTFVIFLEKYYDQDMQINDPTKFLYGIMRKIWLRYLQDKYKNNEHFVKDINDFASYVAQEVEAESKKSDEERIKLFISMLPNSQKQVMKLRLLEKRTLNEICDILEKDMNYVKTTQKRGIKSLKDLVKEFPINKVQGVQS